MTEHTNSDGEVVLLDVDGLANLVERLAGDLARDFGAAPDLCLVGIKRRGDVLARRLGESLAGRLGRRLPVGSLDIGLYRDDFDSLREVPAVGATDVPFALDGRTVVLVDDVLSTGRTVRAALDELLDLGRPARVALVVFVDRGRRELPIRADFAGLTVETAPKADVRVRVAETDGRDGVFLADAEQ